MRRISDRARIERWGRTSLRDDGDRRQLQRCHFQFVSPWDDIEAGHHYARALAAWGLLIAASGVQYDGIARTLSFDPIADGTYFFSTGTAWGVATIAGDDMKLDVRGGRLDLASLSLRGRPLPSVGV